MNVVVLCEFSGTVRDAFTRTGHFAVSVDLLPTESPGRHITADCRSLDYSGFDLAIAHPPCTYLTNAGAGKFWDQHRQEQMEAVEFVKWCYSIGVPRVCVENPAGYLTKSWRPPDQYIDPWRFGHREKKHTGLWLKNLPPLMASLVIPRADRIEFVRGPGMGESKNRWKKRSRFFPGVAQAMAAQWGCLQ